MKPFRSYTLLSFVLLACLANSAAAAETRFTLVDSSTSSWVARGIKNYTVTPALNWKFTPWFATENVVEFRLNGPIINSTGISEWSFTFAAPAGQSLVPGLYTGVERWPFNDPPHPGLQFGSSGRGDNEAGGFFRVLEYTRTPAGAVNSFAADFTHYGEGVQGRYAVGQLRYKATPEPRSVVSIVTGLLFVSAARRRSR